MITTALGKLCFVTAIVEVLLEGNLVHGSSIYVGRHNAGTYSDEGPPGSIYSVECVDQNIDKCKKLIGKDDAEEVCSTTDESLKLMVESYCQATCGFCGKAKENKECEDILGERNCEDEKSFCFDDEVGELFREMCRKTCGKCRQAPSRSEEDNTWVFLHP